MLPAKDSVDLNFISPDSGIYILEQKSGSVSGYSYMVLSTLRPTQQWKQCRFYLFILYIFIGV